MIVKTKKKMSLQDKIHVRNKEEVNSMSESQEQPKYTINQNSIDQDLQMPLESHHTPRAPGAFFTRRSVVTANTNNALLSSRFRDTTTNGDISKQLYQHSVLPKTAAVGERHFLDKQGDKGLLRARKLSKAKQSFQNSLQNSTSYEA